MISVADGCDSNESPPNSIPDRLNVGVYVMRLGKDNAHTPKFKYDDHHKNSQIQSATSPIIADLVHYSAPTIHSQ